MYQPDPSSKRSKRRAKRGFRDLISSTRKHRRANARQMVSNVIDGKVLKPGEKVEPNLRGGKLKAFMFTGSGAYKYY